MGVVGENEKALKDTTKNDTLTTWLSVVPHLIILGPTYRHPRPCAEDLRPGDSERREAAKLDVEK